MIPGISYHETVYVESSLRPTKRVSPPRQVYCYKKAHFSSLKEELKQAKDEFIAIENTLSAEELVRRLGFFAGQGDPDRHGRLRFF